jgi:phosphotriesterase-related protein
MPFVRTILGDIDARELGVCYAHEHVVIDHSYATARNPDFLLNDVEKITAELRAFHDAGGRAMVDTMPMDCGRNPALLAEVSRRSGVHVVCPTGLHLAKYYDPSHWSHAPMDAAWLAGRFIDEIRHGGCGIVKVAGGRDRLDPRERTAFVAAAAAHVATGCPIITHTEEGTAALEQAALLREHGADLSHVVLSHLDRRPDAAYHRAVLKTGACVEYDSAFRWKGAANPTLNLLAELLPEFPGQILLGMDAARSSYWRSYGGRPGLTFLLAEFSDQMRAAGIAQDLIHRVFVENPMKAYAFARGASHAAC